MNVENIGSTSVIRAVKSDLTAFVMKLTHEYKTFEKYNLILDLTQFKLLEVKDLRAFTALAKTHKKARKSFVLVADVDFNKTSGQLVVVPSIQEAHDLIEMDEIERDLGF